MHEKLVLEMVGWKCLPDSVNNSHPKNVFGGMRILPVLSAEIACRCLSARHADTDPLMQRG